MSRRDRERRPGRRSPFREPKPTILIVCEGDTTEPEYLHGLSREFRNQLVEIRIAKDHGVPLTLVEIARSYLKASKRLARRRDDENLKFDSVWCVFDIDDHPNVNAAKDMARGNGIRLAISNPNFELWLLLHFRDSPGIQHRHRITDMVGEFVSSYGENNKHVDFKGQFSAGYRHAVRRAVKLDEQARDDKDEGRNPTTGVYAITELIRTGEDLYSGVKTSSPTSN